MNILVTDGENRASLSAIRSLSKRGYRVIVSGRNRKNVSSVSKHCHKSYKAGDPLRDKVQYLNKILQIVENENIDIVLPMSDSSIYTLNENRHLISPRTRIACPEPEKVNLISNKFRLFKLAKKNDIPIPKTVFIQDRGDFNNKEDQITEFPVVIKPGMSRIPNKKGFIPAGVMYAGSQATLRTFYKTKEALNYPSLIQERIVGPGTGLFTLFDRDKHLALFSHKRLREKPPSGGVSVVCESVALDDEMVEASRKLLSEAEWTGVAMVEFKRDLRDGRAKLMEINGRFWGSLQLAIASGIDFPCLLIDYINGKTPSEVLKLYSIGNRLKWFLGTLDHLIIRLKYNDVNQRSLGNHCSKRQAVISFLRIIEKNTSFDVFNYEDIVPFLFELKEYIKEILGKAL